MIPSLRCGRQPYGVLPVTSLDQWQPPAGQEQAMAPDAWLRDLLIKLRNNIWRPRLGEAFRMGRRSPSAPDADLADIMRMDAISSGYSARTMLGRHYLQHLRAFLGEDLAANGFIGTHDALAAGILQRLGIPWRPRLARTVGADTAWAVSAPLVQDGEVSPWRGLEPNYIAALLAQPSIAALTQMRPDPASPTATASLLQLLLRHALLHELAGAAALVGAAAPNACRRGPSSCRPALQQRSDSEISLLAGRTVEWRTTNRATLRRRRATTSSISFKTSKT